MGEGTGNDAAIIPFISSANIACGYHAGDEETMLATARLCLKNNVAIGAHPSFFDKENFGRTDMHLPLGEVYDLVTEQISLMQKICTQLQTNLHHVKPHGALYNMAARGRKLAAAIALAVKDADDSLILYGLSGSHLVKEARNIGLKSINEVFADRTYQDNGHLTPRSQHNALLSSTEEALNQTLRMIKDKTVISVNGNIIPIIADTICIHGDGEHAVNFAKTIHEKLKQENITITLR
jgi:5-oxoprolinase (ATP-hydrolysing) subunit A